MSTNIEMSIIELHKAFSKLNKSLFDNELPEPAILIQNRGNKKRVLGWCSVEEIWINKQEHEKRYEINLVAEAMSRPLYELMSTLLHEMVHLYNLVNGIKDTSRNCTYHNKQFKESAEMHGLSIEYDKEIGWSLSSLTDSTKKLVDSFKLNEKAFYLSRIDPYMDIEGGDEEGKEKRKTKVKSSTRKYVCPGCGAIIRAAKDINVICGVCMVRFEKEE